MIRIVPLKTEVNTFGCHLRFFVSLNGKLSNNNYIMSESEVSQNGKSIDIDK